MTPCGVSASKLPQFNFNFPKSKNLYLPAIRQGIRSILQIKENNSSDNWVNLAALLESGSTVNLNTTLATATEVESTLITHHCDIHELTNIPFVDRFDDVIDDVWYFIYWWYWWSMVYWCLCMMFSLNETFFQNMCFQPAQNECSMRGSNLRI